MQLSTVHDNCQQHAPDLTKLASLCNLPHILVSDVHLGVDESPWVKYAAGIHVRYTMFDTRQGEWGAILKMDGPASLGPHRHRGAVSGLTLAGSWGYREYDWVARTGSYVRENPGAIHTLYCDDPNGMLAYFMSAGCNEYLDEHGQVLSTQDVFFHAELYANHCRRHGMEINSKLFR